MSDLWDVTRGGIGAVWAATKSGYANLPEWGQPIVWGLAAATPISLAIAVWQLAG